VENLGSVVTQQKTDLIVKVVGKINGVVGTFLIDSGATTEFIDEEYLKKAGLTASGSATRIRLADGVTSKSLGVVNCVRYSLGLEKGGGGAGKKYADRFEVTKLSGYDAILGISWMLQSRLRFLYHRRPLGVAVVTRTVNGIDKYQALQLATGAGSGSIESQVASLGREQVEAAVAELERAAAAAESTGEERARITKVREVAEQIEKDPKPDQSRPRSVEEQQVCDRLLKEFADVFPDALPSGLPPRRPGFEHRIRLKPHNRVPYRRPYKSGPAELKLVQETIRDLTAKGFIKRSQSRFGAPVLFTPKPDGSQRMVVDYRELNKLTTRNGHPLPEMEGLFPMVQGSRYFSKLDLYSGYYQIRVAEEDREKTAFVTRYGSYEFLVLPMGLCNSPGTFMELMNYVFEKQLDKFVIVFLDDILVFSGDLKQHEQHMRDVLEILRQERLFANKKKCDLVRDEVGFLGHIIGAHGLKQEPSKTEAIQRWPRPTTRSEVRQFLGLAGYYRKFVDGFSAIAAPLTRLTGETVHFEWNKVEEQSFQLLKQRLMTAPVLVLPEATKPFVIHTDASNHALGAVLQQDQGKGLQPIGFMSKTLSGSQLSYPVHELEMLAIVEACEHWRHLIRGQTVTARSDHHSLQHFFTQRSLSKRQVRWMESLTDFDLTIEYVKGKNNVVADALSRKNKVDRGEESDTPVTLQSLGWVDESGDGVAIESCSNVVADALSGKEKEEPVTLMSLGLTEEALASVKVDAQLAPMRGVRRVRRGRMAFKTLSAEEQQQDRQKCIEAATTMMERSPDQPRPNAKGAVEMPTQRCTATTMKGVQCKGKTKRSQHCYNHMKKLEGLRIKESSLGSRVGEGLFAERHFNKDETITLYTGDWAWEDSSDTYLLDVSDDWIIDAARTNAAPGRWANDPRGTGRRANARFSYNRVTRMASLKAKYPIKKGDEVLVSYGSNYNWSGVPTIVDLSGIAVVDLLGELLKQAELDQEYVRKRNHIEQKGELNHAVVGGLILEGGKILVPATERAKTLVLHECHDKPTGGHLGRDKTLASVKLRFYWKGMDKMVEQYVTSCVKCQQNKASNQLTAGELMPLPIPNRPWAQMGIDFIGPLPTTKSGMNGVAMMVCRFAKMKHIVPIKMTLTAPQAVGLVVANVVRLHGVPDVIVSDRDARFTAGFWKEFWSCWQTKLGMGTAYHPQTDGQSERENRTLVEAVRSFVSEDQKDWDEQLPLLELAMNSAKQSSTGESPFMMVTGREAILPVDVQLATPIATTANPAVGELQNKMQEIWKRATTSLEKAQARQQKAANRKRRAVEYEVGEKVWLSTAHIQLQGNRELDRTMKFSAKFIGPFKVVERKNANAYKLELPDSFHIHPVVNVERLKRFVDGADQFPSREVEDWRPSGEAVRDANGELEWEVERVIAQRGSERNRSYLIKWVGYPLYESSWQPKRNLENAQGKIDEFHQRLQSKEKQEEEEEEEEE
jgi:hypothetical protein